MTVFKISGLNFYISSKYAGIDFCFLAFNNCVWGGEMTMVVVNCPARNVTIKYRGMEQSGSSSGS